MTGKFSDRERAFLVLIKALAFAFLVVNYWEPLPGITWFLIWTAFTGGIKITLT